VGNISEKETASSTGGWEIGQFYKTSVKGSSGQSETIRRVPEGSVGNRGLEVCGKICLEECRSKCEVVVLIWPLSSDLTSVPKMEVVYCSESWSQPALCRRVMIRVTAIRIFAEISALSFHRLNCL
jgi:hypothetical protein